MALTTRAWRSGSQLLHDECGGHDARAGDQVDVFAGAPQHSNAAAYGTIGVGLRARKPGA